MRDPARGGVTHVLLGISHDPGACGHCRGHACRACRPRHRHDPGRRRWRRPSRSSCWTSPCRPPSRPRSSRTMSRHWRRPLRTRRCQAWCWWNHCPRSSRRRRASKPSRCRTRCLPPNRQCRSTCWWNRCRRSRRRRVDADPLPEPPAEEPPVPSVGRLEPLPAVEPPAPMVELDWACASVGAADDESRRQGDVAKLPQVHPNLQVFRPANGGLRGRSIGTGSA